MSDFMKLFGQLREVQTKIQAVQQKIAQLQATGEAGAGLVKATVNGNKKLLKIEIDPTIINPSDQAMLQDLIVAVVGLAIQAVEEKAKEVVEQSAVGMIGDVPLELVYRWMP